MKLSRAIFYLLIGVFIAQFSFYYVNLPEIVAAHFNVSGEPDGWLTKTEFIVGELVILLLIAAEFALLPQLIEKMPNSLINLPNREYWLETSRRAATLKRIENSLEWLAVILLSLFIAVNQLVFKANINRENFQATAIAIILISFLTAIGVWMIKFINYFKKI